MAVKNILVINGPNLDMLGVREPGVYGKGTLADLQRQVREHGRAKGVAVSFFQSNSEGRLIDRIHEAHGSVDGIVYNPGAHTHYSYALRDALAGTDAPCVEVHLSDIDAREAFRRVSVIAPACVAQVKGRGVRGYCDAIDLLIGGARTRLGEGFEERYPKGQVVVGAPEGAGSAEAGAAAVGAGVGAAAVGAQAAEAGSQDAGAAGAGAGAAGAVGAQAAAGAQDAAGAGAADAGAAGAGGSEGAEMPVGSSCEATAAAARIGRIREALAREVLAAVYLRDVSTIRWATAFDGVFDFEAAHALVVTADRVVLQTDSRYAAACEVAAAGTPIEVDAERGAHPERAARLLGFAADSEGNPAPCDAGGAAGDAAGAAGGRALGIEDGIALSEYRALEAAFSGVELRETHRFALALRAVKDAGEIDRMRAAQTITDAAFSHIVGFMRPGMTEREVQLELEGFMLRHGAEGLAFSSIVACGANGASPHAIPGATRLAAGQCVVLDFGARARGYCSDMTRTVFLGEPDARMRAAYEAIRRANEEVEAMLRPGVTGKEAHELAERVLAEGGFAGCMGHGLGHSVGIDVHEDPSLAPRNPDPLVAGNVVTVEPGIYLPGEFGMRLEDFGVVTDVGFDVFTRSTHEMVVL